MASYIILQGKTHYQKDKSIIIRLGEIRAKENTRELSCPLFRKLQCLRLCGSAFNQSTDHLYPQTLMWEDTVKHSYSTFSVNSLVEREMHLTELPELYVCAQLCLSLCIDWSPPGSSICGILQARILEGAVISFSRGSSRLRDQTHISYTGRQITAVPPGKPD